MGAYDERMQMEDLISKNADRFEPILLQLKTENWNDLQKEERLTVLQEMENLMAELQGRPPVKVIVMPPDSDSCGYFNGEEIAVSPKYFDNETTGIPGIDQNTSWDALDTIIHEGRHAWQLYMMKEFPEAASPDVIMSMLMNEGAYQQNDIFYDMQTVEIDARKYALAVLSGMNAYADEHDLNCIGLDMQILLSIELEKKNAALAVALWSENEDKLDALDATAILATLTAIERNIYGWDSEKQEQIKTIFEQYVESGKATLFDFWRNEYAAFEETIYNYIDQAPVAFYEPVRVKQTQFQDAKTRLLDKLDKMDRFGAAAKKGFSERPDAGIKG